MLGRLRVGLLSLWQTAALLDKEGRKPVNKATGDRQSVVTNQSPKGVRMRAANDADEWLRRSADGWSVLRLPRFGGQVGLSVSRSE